MMKNIAILLFILFVGVGGLNAASFSKGASTTPVLIDQGSATGSCSMCGMLIKHFYKTSHIATLNDGSKSQYCSMACMSHDMSHRHYKKSSVRVVDAHTEHYIVALDAFYVMDSDVKGTMSRRSKIAFKSKKDAITFQREHGGQIVDFNTAVKAALAED